MKLHVTKDTTSKILHIFVQDSSSTTGDGFIGLTYAYTGLTGYYVRPGDATSTQITLADISTLGTFVSGGFKEFDATNMPGVYEIHLPNAALATGADQVVVMYKGAADMAPVLIEIQLTDMDFNTSLPNFFDVMQISSVGYVSSNMLQVDSVDVTTGVADVNVTQISGDSTAADNAELFFDNTGFNASNSTIGTVTDITNQVSGGTSAAEVWGYASRSLTNPVDLQTATQTSIDAIETDTNEIQGKLPTGNIADESNVETHVTTSLNAYDPPTRTELTSDKNEIIAGQSSGGTTPAAIWGYSGTRSLNAEVDLGSVKGTALTESNAGNLANNVTTFFDVFPTTSKDVDDVGTATVVGATLSNTDIINIWTYGYRSLTTSVSGGDGSTATVDDVYSDTTDIKKIIQARVGS